MCDVLKKEFTWSSFGLTHDNHEAFTSSQWKWHHMVYLTYRVLVAVYTMGFFLVNLILAYVNGNNTIMAFLTIWTYLVLSVYFVSAAEVAIIARYRASRGPPLPTSDLAGANDKGVTNVAYVEIADEKLQKNSIALKINDNSDRTGAHGHVTGSVSHVEDITPTMKFTWVLGNIVQVFAIIVTVVYFTALFPLVGYTNFIDINYHGMNTVFVLLDTCISARPVRFLHVIYPLVYGLIYIIFSVVFWSFDHVNNVLYPGVLDWNYPGFTMIWVASLSFVGIPLLQFVYYGAFRLRLHIYKRCYGVDF